MRFRLLIPAAMAAAATYAALVRDDRARGARAVAPPAPAAAPPPAPSAAAPAVLRPVPDPVSPPDVAPPPAPRSAAGSIFDDLAPGGAGSSGSILDLLAGSPAPGPVPDAPAGPPAPAPPARVLEEGRFALGGWAAAGGHSVVSAVTFRRRLPEDVAAERIELELDAADNVPEGGLVVLSDPGFAPDRDGFTLLLAAAAPGPFSAAGGYRVVATD